MQFRNDLAKYWNQAKPLWKRASVISGASVAKWISKIPPQYDQQTVVVQPVHFADLPKDDPRYTEPAPKETPEPPPKPKDPPKDYTVQNQIEQCKVLKLPGNVWHNNSAQGLHNFIITTFDKVMHEVSEQI